MSLTGPTLPFHLTRFPCSSEARSGSNFRFSSLCRPRRCATHLGSVEAATIQSDNRKRLQTSNNGTASTSFQPDSEVLHHHLEELIGASPGCSSWPKLSYAVQRKLAKTLTAKLVDGGNLEDYIFTLEALKKHGISSHQLVETSAANALRAWCLGCLRKGLVNEFLQVMRRLSDCGVNISNLASCKFVLSHCLSSGGVELALSYLDLLPRKSGIYNDLIEECGLRGDLEGAMKVFKGLSERGLHANCYSYRTMMDACGHCGKPQAAMSLLADMERNEVKPNVFVYNSLMNVHAHNPEAVWSIYKRMQEDDVVADATTHNIILKSCSRSTSHDSVSLMLLRDWRTWTQQTGVRMDVITYSTIIQILANARKWEEALEVKADMEAAGMRPNVVTWTSLIGACVKAGLVEQAFQLFQGMKDTGVFPNTHTYNQLINACIDGGQVDRALRIFQEMKERSGAASPGSPRPHVVRGGRVGRPGHTSPAQQEALRALRAGEQTRTPDGVPSLDGQDFVPEARCRPDEVTYNTLMKAHRSSPEQALEVMQEMREAGIRPSETTWSTLIDAYGSQGNVEGALSALDSMRRSGLRGDVIAFTSALRVCMQAGHVGRAFVIFDQMKKEGVKPNLVTYNTLLRRQTRCRELHEIQRTLALYEEMRSAGYSPNNDLLSSLINEWAEGVIEWETSVSELLMPLAHARAAIAAGGGGGGGGEGGGTPLQGRWQQRPPLATKGGANSDPALSEFLVKKVALQARGCGDEEDLLTVDLHGLSKTEARTAVLCVLRLIKEQHGQHAPNHTGVQHDLVIITGTGRHSEVPGVSVVREAIFHVLERELGLPVQVPGLLSHHDDHTKRRTGAQKTEEDESAARLMIEVHASNAEKEESFESTPPPPLPGNEPSLSGDGPEFRLCAKKPMLARPVSGSIPSSSSSNQGRFIVRKENLNIWLQKKNTKRHQQEEHVPHK